MVFNGKNTIQKIVEKWTFPRDFFYICCYWKHTKHLGKNPSESIFRGRKGGWEFFPSKKVGDLLGRKFIHLKGCKKNQETNCHSGFQFGKIPNE